MIQLDPWQEEVAKYQGDLLLCTGRRVGKTYILSKKGIDWMATHKNCPIVIVSLTEDQAMIIMSMALNYAREVYPSLLGRGENKPTMKSLHLNGGKMIVRPVGNSGDGARGFEGGILIVDEASRMPKMFWIAAKPILMTTNGQIWMGSTPAGKDGYFWDKYDEAVNKKLPEARFKVFCMSTEEVMLNREINASWTENQRAGAIRILKEDRREMSKKEFMQEYEGRFVEDILQFFPTELIKSCMTLTRGSNSLSPSGKKYLGVDVAGGTGRDETVLCSVQKIKDRIEMIDLERSSTEKIPETFKKILLKDMIYNYSKLWIDDGGMGIALFQSLLDHPQTKRRTIAINNASRPLDVEENPARKKILKEDLYNNLKNLMETGKIFLFNEEEILASLVSIQADYENGKLKIWGDYSHIAESLIRACLCSQDKSLNIWVEFI